MTNTPSLDEQARSAVLSCLAQPGFAGTKVAGQVLGHGPAVVISVGRIADRTARHCVDLSALSAPPQATT